MCLRTMEAVQWLYNVSLLSAIMMLVNSQLTHCILFCILYCDYSNGSASL